MDIEKIRAVLDDYEYVYSMPKMVKKLITVARAALAQQDYINRFNHHKFDWDEENAATVADLEMDMKKALMALGED